MACNDQPWNVRFLGEKMDTVGVIGIIYWGLYCQVFGNWVIGGYKVDIGVILG